MKAALLFAAISIPGLALADPNELLTSAIVAFGRGDLEGSLAKLEAAQSETSDPSALAKIHRQRAIVFEVQEKRLDAVVQFLHALYFNAALELDAREHRGQVSALFACAQRMHADGVKEAAVRTRWPTAFDAKDWTCPLGDPQPASAALIAAPPPPPVASVEEDSGLGLTIALIAGGLALVGGAITLGVVLGSGDAEIYGGTTDTVAILSRDD